MNNQSVVSVESLKGRIAVAMQMLKGVVEAIETKTIVQTVSTPEPPKAKKAGKKRGRKPGQKNKTTAAPPTPPAA